MLDSFCPIPKCITTHLTINFFVNGAPCALIVKTKSNQLQGLEATLLKVLHSSSSLGTDGKVGVEVKTSTSTPCHIICQLGLGLDSVDSVKPYF